MSERASDVYEVVIENPSGPKSWLRTAGVLIVGLITMGQGPTNPGGLAVSVRRKDNGEEFVRYTEAAGDDEGYLVIDIRRDLESMTLPEFEAAWSHHE